LVALGGIFSLPAAGAVVGVDGTAAAQGFSRRQKPDGHKTETGGKDKERQEQIHAFNIGQVFRKIKPGRVLPPP